MDEGVILWIFFPCVMARGLTTIPLGPLGLPWSDLTEKAWNQTFFFLIECYYIHLHLLLHNSILRTVPHIYFTYI